ncbi:MAG: hypothetical protein HW374_606, partial [Bacteroidetes bacterium]|nr:hypothetical protein [Bacteroidota bacterium]
MKRMYVIVTFLSVVLLLLSVAW